MVKTISAAAVAVLVAGIVGCAADLESTTTASAPPSGSVWVADEAGNSITVIDAATNAVATTLTGVKGPHNIEVGRDGSVVYAVSSAGVVVGHPPGRDAARAAAGC